MWTLIQLVILIALAIVGAILGDTRGVVYSIYALATLLPGLAVTVRRLHDTDRSGWWILIVILPLIGPILLLVWYCYRGTDGNNRFGPPAPTSPDVAASAA
jgi:uncharacterized membrane protein YhaH (DUF805 family)